MWTNAAPRFHSAAWLLWLAAAMLAALLTRNPYYLAMNELDILGLLTIPRVSGTSCPFEYFLSISNKLNVQATVNAFRS